jgi:hypothetical protein
MRDFSKLIEHHPSNFFSINEFFMDQTLERLTLFMKSEPQEDRTDPSKRVQVPLPLL